MRKRILVVDDEELILFAISEFFESLDYDVDCVTSMIEAKNLITRKNYTAVVADLCLTDLNSREGLAILGFARQTNPKTLTILLTAHSTDSVILEARDLGVHVFLEKPIPLNEIAKRIA